ncbi:MAG TPA: NAD(P)H-binding protein [Gaiellaceae bacterium]|nr:NAD(P)H-binding protein [Gaiellaceae bacterium]
MRIFLAGASGVIGVRLLPLLVEQGHVVAAMTRSTGKAEHLQALGGEPVVCDVFDADRLKEAVMEFGPDAVMHQLTDLPDRLDELDAHAAANDRMRSEGTRNLIAAAKAAGADRFVAQSIAWRSGGARDEVVDRHERLVLAIDGVVARYGRLYGPGTYYEDELPPPPRIEIDAAARETLPLLVAAPGTVTLAEP